MKKYIIAIIIVLIMISPYIIYRSLPYEFIKENGTIQEEVVSPSGDYTAQSFYHYWGGAAGGVNVYVNVIFHRENDTVRTVYFSDSKSKFEINWINDDKLHVTNSSSGDRSIVLTVGKEIYDASGKACSKFVITKNYACYSKKSTNSSKIE